MASTGLANTTSTKQSRENSLRAAEWRSNLAVYIALTIIVLLMAFPFLWTLSTAMKTPVQAARWPPELIPNPIAWNNFTDALLRWRPFPIFFRNTFIIAFFVVLGEVVSSSFIAYGFARLRFPGREFLFAVLLSTMMVPFVVRLVPLFLLYRQWGWINTFYPLIVPYFFGGTPFFIFLLRQFYRSIPEDLADAARVDGASEFRIWQSIMLPLSQPALAAVAIFSFQNVWNDFMGPLVFLREESKQTVMLGIYGLVGIVPEWPPVMAAVVVVTLPMLVIFFLFQNFFVEGVTVTGMKG
jgi:multiple sugar transport system permease protein